MFYFSHILGRIAPTDSYCSEGLKPPIVGFHEKIMVKKVESLTTWIAEICHGRSPVIKPGWLGHVRKK